MTFPEETIEKPETAAEVPAAEDTAPVPEVPAAEEKAQMPEEKTAEDMAPLPEVPVAEDTAPLPEEKAFAAAPEPAPAAASGTPAPSPKPAGKPKKEAKVRVKKVRKLRRKKRRILEHTAEKDTRYRGPLSYRHFRTAAWIFLALGQVVLLMRLDQKIEPEYAVIYDTPIAVLSVLAALALPLWLIANFAVILDGREGSVRQMLRYAVFAVCVFLGFNLFRSRYLLGTLGVLLQSPEEAPAYLDMIADGAVPQGFLAFNIFVDLFLCSLFMLLVNYRPKKHFQGKKVLILRILAVFPAAYELASIALKIMAGSGRLHLPLWAWPLLTTKPPMTFLVFILLAFYVKRRERLFLRHGRTHEDFQQYMQTNANSWRFSLFTAKTFFFTALLDLIAVFVLPALIAAFGSRDPEASTALMDVLINSGFGGSIELLPMIPFMLLFSYTRTYKSRLYDALLPFAGIALIFFVWIEGSYQAVQMYGRVLPEGIGDAVKMLLTGLFGQP